MQKRTYDPPKTSRSAIPPIDTPMAAMVPTAKPSPPPDDDERADSVKTVVGSSGGGDDDDDGSGGLGGVNEEGGRVLDCCEGWVAAAVAAKGSAVAVKDAGLAATGSAAKAAAGCGAEVVITGSMVPSGSVAARGSAAVRDSVGVAVRDLEVVGCGSKWLGGGGEGSAAHARLVHTHPLS